MTKNQKLREIINHYGIAKQLKYLQNEVFELNEAVIKYEESKRNPLDVIVSVIEPIFAYINNRKPINIKENIAGELADVMVMLKQIQLHYDIKTETINEIMLYKIDRQLERIKGESNETNN